MEGITHPHLGDTDLSLRGRQASAVDTFLSLQMGESRSGQSLSLYKVSTQSSAGVKVNDHRGDNPLSARGGGG